MTSHPCPQCQGNLVYTHSNPNTTAGIVLLVIGVLLAPVCIGIPMIIMGAVMMSQQKIAWHCSNCGRVFPTVKESTMRVCIIVCCFLLCAPLLIAQSDGKKIEKWTHVGWSKDDVVRMYFAPDSVRRNEDKVSGWTRFDFPGGSSALIPDTNWGSVRIFVVVNCDSGAAKSYEILFYDSTGRFAKKAQDNDTAKEQKGTIGWALFEYLCERRTSFPAGPPVLKPKS